MRHEFGLVDEAAVIGVERIKGPFRMGLHRRPGDPEARHNIETCMHIFELRGLSGESRLFNRLGGACWRHRGIERQKIRLL